MIQNGIGITPNPGPGRDDLARRVRALAEEHDMLPRGEIVLCALSGGADSVCLLHVLHALREDMGFTLAAAHFNHRLRGEESEGDEAFVREICRKLNVPLTVGEADVAEAAAAARRGVEETAREMRYAFLTETARARGAGRIATAHNARDNAETLLLHLVRGSGLRGLGGIPPRRGEIVRPLLEIDRGEILAWLAGRNIPFREDSSNKDERYARNYLRARVLPLLEELNPRFVASCARTARLLRVDEDCLRADMAALNLGLHPVAAGAAADAGEIAAAPDPVAARAVRALLAEAGGGETCSSAHIEGIVRLCRGTDPSARLSLPGGWTARRVYGEIQIVRIAAPAGFVPAELSLPGETAAGVWSVVCREAVCPLGAAAEKDHFYLARRAVVPPVTVRPRQTGDDICLSQKGGRGSLKKRMIDAKIPREKRDGLPVLCDGAGVIAAAGLGAEVSRLAHGGEDAWEILFIENRARGAAGKDEKHAGSGY